MICFQLAIGVVSFRANRDCKVDQEIKQRVLCFTNGRWEPAVGKDAVVVPRNQIQLGGCPL